MLIFHDPRCADYGSSMRPEQPARITKTVVHLRAAHPDWLWPAVPPADTTAPDDVLLLAHTPAHLRRLTQPRDFDPDTPFFPDIADHARRSVAAALAATEAALARDATSSLTPAPAFALMRPPGHHATADAAMGFCYLNQIAIAALHAHQNLRLSRIAVWDFDAHHGNGTEAILHAANNAPASSPASASVSQLSTLNSQLRPAPFFFASVHQFPGYPGTGPRDLTPHIRNWPIAPHSPRAVHLSALRESLDAVVAFAPDLLLVSAGFDAYARDPITAMTLELEDFATLGRWLRETRLPAAALLEGGYSSDLPLLIDAFLSAWKK